MMWTIPVNKIFMIFLGSDEVCNAVPQAQALNLHSQLIKKNGGKLVYIMGFFMIGALSTTLPIIIGFTEGPTFLTA